MYIHMYVCIHISMAYILVFCFSHTLFTPTCSTAMSLRITDNKKMFNQQTLQKQSPQQAQTHVCVFSHFRLHCFSVQKSCCWFQ